MAIPKLTTDSAGRVHGANVTLNSPWPCPNGRPGGMSVPSGVLGVVMHTMVGNLPGTIQVFNNPSFQASAHFGVDQAGAIHQFGPVNGWEAWAEVAGNPHWFSIEFADDGNPANPLTQAQVNAGAQLLELLSRTEVGRFALQVTDSVAKEGFGVHRMGGASWGGHSCPQLANGTGPRAGQRTLMVALAKAIRSGQEPQPAPPAKPATVPQIREWTTAGQSSLAQLAKDHGTTPATILRLTMQHGGPFQPDVAALVNGLCTGQADWRKPMPAGLKLWLT